ncbi:hypothetical protein [Desulfomonile tiedjei]|uniref:Uncharacterized protein n=1 Tax=Desulfomonile tiedjei (strain ATCC 49306 / DSM 6799 / DCB-1) TaxID=706587 RepID=I4C9Y6_DESTA|nr:hypothetical protein [Desulfomonile tiedjei]AFM26377.1 hypothetical protein Desti_3733 [Desulfomonile tiedjei DSM 6799]
MSAPKKISAKAIMTDLKAGLTDTQLMDKYDISFQGLQELFEKLIQAGLATPTYFEKRSVKQIDTPKESVKTCPYCGYSSMDQFRECPRCQQETSDWLNTVELTKILTGSFD